MIKICTYYICEIVLSYRCCLSSPCGSQISEYWFFFETDWRLPTCITDTISIFFLWINLDFSSAVINIFSKQTKFDWKILIYCYITVRIPQPQKLSPPSKFNTADKNNSKRRPPSPPQLKMYFQLVKFHFP